MSLKLVTPPEELPLTLDEVKAHLRVEGTDEDSYLTALIGAATDHAQNVTNRQLMTATYRLKLAVTSIPKKTTLPRPPFVAIESIQALDKDGNSYDFTEFEYSTTEDEPATLNLASSSAWFNIYTLSEIEINYTAGYESAAQVPNAIKQAMLLIIGHLYTNREEVIVGTINSFNSFASNALLSPYRIFNV